MSVFCRLVSAPLGFVLFLILLPHIVTFYNLYSIVFFLQVNDIPDFLSGKHQERCQHIRIVYVTKKPAAKQRNWLKRAKKEGLPPAAPSSRRNSHCPEITSTLQGNWDSLCNLMMLCNDIRLKFMLFVRRVRDMWNGLFRDLILWKDTSEVYVSSCFFICNSSHPVFPFPPQDFPQRGE